MKIEDLISSVESGKLDNLKAALEVNKAAMFITDAINSTKKNTNQRAEDKKQYNPSLHDVLDPSIRKDKVINDSDGRAAGTVNVARLSVPAQKEIVLLAASFLGVPEYISSPADPLQTDLAAVLNIVMEENKLEYQFKDIMKTTMSERECAELWYTQPAEAGYWDGTPMAGGLNYKLRCKILSPSRGDSMYPVYDALGDMIAFGRYYESEQFNVTTDTTDKVKHFDVYTKDRFYFMWKSDKEVGWSYNTEPVAANATDEQKSRAKKGIPNIMGKIPVVYYSQPATEWQDVQGMIDRLEVLLSNLADSNDYMGSPIVVAEGDVEGFSEKGEQGKVLMLKNGAKVSYLQLDNAPASVKMEIEQLVDSISFYTHSPKIDLENLKGIGTVSGTAFRFYFSHAHLKAADKEQIFGIGVQRRINYLKTAVAIINSKFKPAVRMSIKPKFTYFLPKDIAGEVETIVAAYNAGIISLETALKLNPLVEDAVNELELIKAEAEAKPKDLPPVPPKPAD